jgi:hypothetical protein
MSSEVFSALEKTLLYQRVVLAIQSGATSSFRISCCMAHLGYSQLERVIFL